jgi:hypothetical protein
MRDSLENIYSCCRLPKKKEISSDRFGFEWHFEDDGPYRMVWENRLDIGPEAYNLSSIEYIMFNDNNDVRAIRDTGNPFYEAKRKLSSDIVKFNP